MWGVSSKSCENNCQCAGLITENFKINSGNNATKRKQEEALAYNFKVKIKPHSIDFTSHAPNSPKKVLGEIQNTLTPQRKVLGEIQNSPSYKLESSPISFNSKQNSPRLHGISNIINSPVIPKNYSPISRIPTTSGISKTQNSPVISRIPNSPVISRIPNSPVISRIPNSPVISRIPNSPGISRISNSPGISRIKNSPTTPQTKQRSKVNPLYLKNSPAMERLRSPLGGCRERRRSKLSKIFEERTIFKANKENENFIIEEETQDCAFGMEKRDWTMSKLDFSDFKKEREMDTDVLVPERSTTLEPDMESLQDLEEEFVSNNFDECTKYEIISTDSPDIISGGRTSSRKVNQRNFVFGAPLSENETSTSFNRPSSSRALNFDRRIERTKSNRALNFDETENSFDKIEFDQEQSYDFNAKTKSKLNLDDSNFDDSFEFTSPMTKEVTPRKSMSVKKSLKFTESPFDKNSQSPCFNISKRQTSESMESGFVSELEEPFLEMEESTSPKIISFGDLLSGQIKENIRPSVHRSLSFNPVSKRLRDEPSSSNKRLRSDKTLVPQRPVLQRAFSENNASIMSALARSIAEPDLIGDFSSPFALPLTDGDHSDLKSISGDTLAALIRGKYTDSIADFQVIDCRYPYEYEGGHILGAVNMFTSEQVLELVNKTPLPPKDDQKRSILVFHCEFSLERGPKLSRFLRSSDRAKNQENYPNLHYPEIYLLHAGYRSFFKSYPELCSPNGYTAMLDPQHRHLLRKHRSLQPSGRRSRFQ